MKGQAPQKTSGATEAIQQYALAVDQKSVLAKLNMGGLDEENTSVVQLVDAEDIWQDFLDDEGLF